MGLFAACATLIAPFTRLFARRAALLLVWPGFLRGARCKWLSFGWLGPKPVRRKHRKTSRPQPTRGLPNSEGLRWTETAAMRYVGSVSTLEEIKVATKRLRPDEQVELFNWWVQSGTLKTRQLAALKRELAVGIDQLEQGRYRAYDDTNVMQLGEEVGLRRQTG